MSMPYYHINVDMCQRVMWLILAILLGFNFLKQDEYARQINRKDEIYSKQ